MDHSGSPSPYGNGFSPDVESYSSFDEVEAEERLLDTLANIYGVEKERIALTSGAQNANFLFFNSCVGKDSLVAVENPTYMPIRSVAASVSKVIRFQRAIDSIISVVELAFENTKF